jgi:hypothetical protein
VNGRLTLRCQQPKSRSRTVCTRGFTTCCPGNLLSIFGLPVACARWPSGSKKIPSAVGKALRNYRFTCRAKSPWQPCFDHATPSEWSMRASPTVSAVGSIMRQQFAPHLQPPVLTFGNRSAPHRLGESSIGESHLDGAGRSTEATYGKIRLHDSVRWLWLASPLHTNVRHFALVEISAIPTKARS